MLTIVNPRLNLPTSPTEWQEITSQRVAVVVGIVSLLIIGSFSLWHGQTLPAMGWFSAASVLAFSCGIAGMIGFFAGYQFNQDLAQRIKQPWRRQLYGLCLSVAYAIFYAVLGMLVALFIDNAFKGIALDGFTITCLGVVGAVISSYTSLQWASNLTSIHVSQTMVGFLVIGVCSSMILNSDPEWWRRNFSYLGDIHGNTFVLFGLTLIVSGLLLLAIAEYIGYDLKLIGQQNRLFAERARWLQLAMVGIAVCMVLLGVFPNVVGEFLGLLHNLAAKVLVGIYIAMIILVSWLLPGINRTFYYVSYAFGLTIGVMYFVIFGWFHYLNVTSFELLSFFICIAWLYLLLQIISAKADDVQKEIK